MNPALRESIRRAEELDARERIAITLVRCTGLALVWANLRQEERRWSAARERRFGLNNGEMVTHLHNQFAVIDRERLALHYKCDEQRQELERLKGDDPGELAPLWALQDDEHSYSVFATLEDALADRENNEHTTAVVQPVCIAMPTIDAEAVIDRLNSQGCEAFPCDFGIDSDLPGDLCPSSTVELHDVSGPVLDELSEALSAAFAAWARKHVGFAEPGKASIQAWNVVGPARRFVLRKGKWKELAHV